MPLSIIFVDLDYFKRTNDLYGHIAGDHLLREFAFELRRNIRKNTDWVARYGGDEFLLCLIDANYTKAKAVAERIRKTVMHKTFNHNGHEIQMTCSLGVYTINDFIKPLTSDIILDAIDKKLYKAKNAGRNKVR